MMPSGGHVFNQSVWLEHILYRVTQGPFLLYYLGIRQAVSEKKKVLELISLSDAAATKVLYSLKIDREIYRKGEKWMDSVREKERGKRSF